MEQNNFDYDIFAEHLIFVCEQIKSKLGMILMQEDEKIKKELQSYDNNGSTKTLNNIFRWNIYNSYVISAIEKVLYLTSVPVKNILTQGIPEKSWDVQKLLQIENIQIIDDLIDTQIATYSDRDIISQLKVALEREKK